MLFRSEEGIDRWCAGQGRPRGEAVPLGRVWDMARRWYADRLDPAFRGRSATEAEAIFRSLGLASPFWRAAR